MIISFLAQAFAYFIQFILNLIAGILGAIFYALPWLLRGLAVIGWLVSAFISIQTVHSIYSPFSDAIPVLALQFLVITLMVLWAMVGLMDHKDIWGLLAAGGAVMYGVSYGATWLTSTWQYAHMFFRVLPVTMLAVGMITFSIRTRSRRMSRMGNAKSKSEVTA